MKPQDIDLWEINEAFASVVLRFVRDLDLSRQRQRQRRRDRARPPARRDRRRDPRHGARRARAAILSTALVTLCVGGGMGTATIIERV
jgi:acetyl-CoA C-acetyltransferase